MLLKDKMADNIKAFQDKEEKEKTEILYERIVKQTDKSFVLAIDPETKLPFMINMGLKTADVCDLDNRPESARNGGDMTQIQDLS